MKQKKHMLELADKSNGYAAVMTWAIRTVHKVGGRVLVDSYDWLGKSGMI